jgi:hypothetical protein
MRVGVVFGGLTHSQCATPACVKAVALEQSLDQMVHGPGVGFD